jgi:FtsP/CotA-like multicopper oxidase with cupredoxin domain
MNRMMLNHKIFTARGFLFGVLAAGLLSSAVNAAVPGITGTSAVNTFNLTVNENYISQPDGTAVYSWGYGCAETPPAANFRPDGVAGSCSTMQIPGPTLIVTEGQTVTVTLTNNLPAAAGNTSILFPGFSVTSSAVDTSTPTGPKAGLLTTEAPVGGSVTYTFIADKPGTHAYYSGTQGDLQIEMGLYGAVIVLPAGVPACDGKNTLAKSGHGQSDFRLATTGNTSSSFPKWTSPFTGKPRNRRRCPVPSARAA